jgi:hypothetical protein
MVTDEDADAPERESQKLQLLNFDPSAFVPIDLELQLLAQVTANLRLLLRNADANTRRPARLLLTRITRSSI